MIINTVKTISKKKIPLISIIFRSPFNRCFGRYLLGPIFTMIFLAFNRGSTRVYVAHRGKDFYILSQEPKYLHIKFY